MEKIREWAYDDIQKNMKFTNRPNSTKRISTNNYTELAKQKTCRVYDYIKGKTVVHITFFYYYTYASIN